MARGGQIRITHTPSGKVIAEGPLGWGITPFEGSYYIQRRYLKTGGFRVAVPREHPELNTESL